MKKDYFGKSLLVITLVALGATGLYAWTGPTGTPPNSNVSDIINTSAVPQVKTGDFSTQGIVTALGGLTVSGGESFFLGNTTFTGMVTAGDNFKIDAGANKAYASSTLNTDSGTTLTTKDYVDANAGGLSVYTADGAPLGKLLRLRDLSGQAYDTDNGEYIQYVDPVTFLSKNVKPVDRYYGNGIKSFYYGNSTCTGTKFAAASYGTNGSNWLNEQAYHNYVDGKYSIIEAGLSCSSGGSSNYYYWDFTSSSCKVVSGGAQNNCYFNSTFTTKRTKVCGSGDCMFK